jgi:hypothetical protein
MESTGVYWIPVYDILEQYGIRPCLVNPRNMKNVPGKRNEELPHRRAEQAPFCAMFLRRGAPPSLTGKGGADPKKYAISVV